MSETKASPAKIERKLWFPNRAGAALGFSILGLGILVLVAIEEVALSGRVMLMTVGAQQPPPYPLFWRIATLIPLWASIIATFALSVRNRNWSSKATAMVAVACLLAVGMAFLGWQLSIFSIWTPRS